MSGGNDRLLMEVDFLLKFEKGETLKGMLSRSNFSFFKLFGAVLFLRRREAVAVLYSKGVSVRSHICGYVPSTQEGSYHAYNIHERPHQPIPVYIKMHQDGSEDAMQGHICINIPSSFTKIINTLPGILLANDENSRACF